MTEQFPGGSPQEEPWERLLRSVFGADADEAIAQLRARGMDVDALNAVAGLTDDPRLMDQVLGQVRSLLSMSSGPVNRDVAHDVARQVAVTGGDPSVSEAHRRAALEAFGVADLWLDTATELAPAGGTRHVWSRSEWVEQTLPAWSQLAAPVAANLVAALTRVLGERLPEDMSDMLPPGMAAVLPPGALADPSALLERLGSAMFGMQIGQAAGTFSREVFGLTDIGVPLVTEPMTALLPANVEAFAEGLDTPLEEVRLFLTLRETAHARLFTHVPWLRGHLLGLIDAYARGITIDVDALDEAVRDVDPADPEQLRSALAGGGFFGIAQTDEQRSTLDRLETTLALVEGWVDEVATTAALPHLPHAMPLREMLRRRRAAGGPAEQTFATLVGLELRPRRSREAAALWRLIAEQSGTEGREAVWDHPDLLPTAEDLDDPAGFAGRRATADAEFADVDRAIEEFLAEAEGEGGADAGTDGDGPGGGGPEGGGPVSGGSDGEDVPRS